jgi:hypothetical protein
MTQIGMVAAFSGAVWETSAGGAGANSRSSGELGASTTVALLELEERRRLLLVHY